MVPGPLGPTTLGLGLQEGLDDNDDEVMSSLEPEDDDDGDDAESEDWCYEDWGPGDTEGEDWDPEDDADDGAQEGEDWWYMPLIWMSYISRNYSRSQTLTGHLR